MLFDMSLKKIISGGQTGVDRGALDAAILLEIEHGGWCPRGRLAEDGRIPNSYQLEETKSADYPTRTERNVLDSDGTLILYRGQLSGGTFLTYRLAEQHDRPCLTVDLDSPISMTKFRKWLSNHKIKMLNVAGPRESQSHGIGQAAYEYLIKILKKQPKRKKQV